MSINQLSIKNNNKLFVGSFTIDNEAKFGTTLSYNAIENSEFIFPDVNQTTTNGNFLCLTDPDTGATEWTTPGSIAVSPPVATGIYNSNYTGMNGTNLNQAHRDAQKIFYIQSVGNYPGGSDTGAGYIDNLDYEEIKYDDLNTRVKAPSSGIYTGEINATFRLGGNPGTFCFSIRDRNNNNTATPFVKYYASNVNGDCQRPISLLFSGMNLIGGVQYAIYFKLVGPLSDTYCTYASLKLSRDIPIPE